MKNEHMVCPRQNNIQVSKTNFKSTDFFNTSSQTYPFTIAIITPFSTPGANAVFFNFGVGHKLLNDKMLILNKYIGKLCC
jgi:hypothetical protein